VRRASFSNTVCEGPDIYGSLLGIENTLKSSPTIEPSSSCLTAWFDVDSAFACRNVTMDVASRNTMQHVQFHTSIVVASRRCTDHGAHDLVGLNRALVVRLHRRRSRRMVLAKSDLLRALNDGLGGGQELPGITQAWLLPRRLTSLRASKRARAKAFPPRVLPFGDAPRIQ